MTPPPLPRRAVLVVVALVAVVGLLAAFLLGRPGTADRAGSPPATTTSTTVGSSVADRGTDGPHVVGARSQWAASGRPGACAGRRAGGS